MRWTSSSAAVGDVSYAARSRPTRSVTNPHRDDLAVMRFALRSRDWRLIELLARLLMREPVGWLGVAHRTYRTLSGRLGLGSDLQ